MAGTTDKVKGRTKVAVGAVTGDKSLENDGRIDRIAGEAKDRLADVSNQVERWLDQAGQKGGSTVHDVRRTVENWIDKARS